jgi:hypothetical protein
VERSLSISDLAALLKVPVSTIYSWNRQSAGPPYHKIGKSPPLSGKRCVAVVKGESRPEGCLRW